MKKIVNYEIDEQTARAIVKVTGNIKTIDLHGTYNLSEKETDSLTKFYDMVEKEEA